MKNLEILKHEIKVLAFDDMRIAVVREGFGHPNSESDVDDKVREGAALLAKLGATVDVVTIPATGCMAVPPVPALLQAILRPVHARSSCGIKTAAQCLRQSRELLQRM